MCAVEGFVLGDVFLHVHIALCSRRGRHAEAVPLALGAEGTEICDGP